MLIDEKAVSEEIKRVGQHMKEKINMKGSYLRLIVVEISSLTDRNLPEGWNGVVKNIFGVPVTKVEKVLSS